MKYRIGGALILAAALLCAAAGCGGTALKHTRHLVAETCTDQRPFLFEEDGAPAGFDADLLRLLAARAAIRRSCAAPAGRASSPISSGATRTSPCPASSSRRTTPGRTATPRRIS